MTDRSESFPPDDAVSRDFGGGGNRTRERVPPESLGLRGFSPCSPGCPKCAAEYLDRSEEREGNSTSVRSDFTASVEIAGVVAEIKRDGKHLNLHLFEREDSGGLWNFEPLEQAIPKLRSILAAALLAAGHVDPMTT